MVFKLLMQFVIGILGLWLAVKFVPNAELTGPIYPTDLNWHNFTQTLMFAGILLGALNFFVKPILNLITFPLRIITFNLVGFVIVAGLIRIVDIISPGITIHSILSLSLTALIISILSSFLSNK